MLLVVSFSIGTYNSSSIASLRRRDRKIYMECGELPLRSIHYHLPLSATISV